MEGHKCSGAAAISWQQEGGESVIGLRRMQECPQDQGKGQALGSVEAV